MTDSGEATNDLGDPSLRTVLDAIADGVYYFDTDWTLAVVNDAAIERSTHDRETMLGRTMRDLQELTMSDPPRADDHERFKRLFESGRRQHVRTTATFETVDGETPYSVRTRRVSTRDGSFAGVVMTMRDVSERAAAEAALRRQNERLEEFARLVSHDLRNPLNVAQMSLETIDADDDEALDRATRALERMDALVEDVLTLSRTEAPLDEVERVDLGAVTGAAWETLSTRDATLVVDTDRTVEADRSRLLRALENLLGNAVAHGPDDVTVVVGDCEGGFFVADDGPGVPPAERDRVFESGYSTAEHGTGLGLDIVRDAMRAHGWAVDVTDSTDGGARFEVRGIDDPDD